MADFIKKLIIIWYWFSCCFCIIWDFMGDEKFSTKPKKKWPIFETWENMLIIFIDFNETSAHPGLFYALMLGNHVPFMFIFTFLCIF